MPKRDFDKKLLSLPNGMGVTGIAGLRHCSSEKVGESITSEWNVSGVRRG
jgi:hypothetical protein